MLFFLNTNLTNLSNFIAAERCGLIIDSFNSFNSCSLKITVFFRASAGP